MSAKIAAMQEAQDFMKKYFKFEQGNAGILLYMENPLKFVATQWRSDVSGLLEHGHSVVLARPDPERGPDAPYESIKERSAAEFIPVGMELTVDGRRVKINSIDAAHDIVRLKILDTAYSYLQRSIQAVRDLVAKARATVLGADDSAPPPPPPEPKPEQVEIDGGQLVPPPLRQLPANRAGNAIISRSPMITWAWAAKKRNRGYDRKDQGA